MKSNSKSNNKQNLVLGILAVLILAGIAWISLRETDEASQDSAVKTAQTLSPALFSGKARDAYQAALDVPEVLEQVSCYCGCMQNNGHKNNLFCFKDEHAATWDMCQDIALDARQMHNQGVPTDQITVRIREKYGK